MNTLQFLAVQNYLNIMLSQGYLEFSPDQAQYKVQGIVEEYTIEHYILMEDEGFIYSSSERPDERIKIRNLSHLRDLITW